MRSVFVLMIAMFALIGCKPEAPDEADLCGATGLQDRLGQPVSAFEFGADARIIPPDTAVTQDFRPERLNVELDGDGIITRIACG